MKLGWIAGAVVLAALAGALWWSGQLRSALPLLAPAPALSEREHLPLTAASGFEVRLFAHNLPGARVLTRDPQGALVVSLTGEGSVVALPDEDGNGVADATYEVIKGLDNPHGLAFIGGTLYIAEEGRVGAYTYDTATRKATFVKTIAALPTGGGHSTRTLWPHPDNERLLVSVGSSCNVCEEADSRRASILAITLATGEVAPYARGLRNTVFMTTHPVTGDVWGTEMGRDLLGDNIPPDEINILREGGNYGWPICFGQNIHDDDFDKKTYIRNPCMEPFEKESHIDLQAHSAPLGLAFVPEEGWPEEYWHDALVAYHGSWNRSVPTGYRVVRIGLTPEGEPTGEVDDFLSGFRESGSVTGRPVAILAEPGGTVYVSDDRAGALYRITRK
jgi:glucose/arabinose dehydrogenase